MEPGERTPPATDRRGRARTRVQSASERRPLALMVAATLLYSVGPIMIQSSSAAGPVFSFWRLLAGVPILAAPLPFYLRMGGRRPSAGAWRWAMWGGLAFGIHQVLFVTAIKATSVTDVTLIGTLVPVVTAILAVPVFGERPGAGFRAWTALAMGGAAIVILGVAARPEGDSVGMAMAVGGVVFFALFFLAGKLSRTEIDVLPFLFGMTAVATVVVGAVCVVTRQPLASVTARDLALAAGVALVPGGVAHFMTTWPMRWVPANVPALLQLTIPALSGLMAWWLLGEEIRAEHLVGGAVTLAGVAGAVLSPGNRDFATGRVARRREAETEEGVCRG